VSAARTVYLVAGLAWMLHGWCHPGYAQREGYVWMFGNRAGIDFYTGYPRALDESAMNAPVGSASIADSTGRLLFYTHGRIIFNALHVPMANGTDLGGSPISTQAALIVPQPENPGRYYVFTTDRAARANGLQYHIVDMSRQNGLGEVVAKNLTLHTPVTEKLAGVRHANGRDVWIAAHEWDSDVFLAYRLTPDSLHTVPVRSSAGTPVVTTAANTLGQLKFSPDGTRAAAALRQNDFLDILNFDAATGVFSSNYTREDILNPFGLEFSPDSKLLYVSGFYYEQTTTIQNLYQLELDRPQLPPAVVDTYSIALFVPETAYGSLQAAPDGKIYVARTPTPYLGVVNNPNARGADCNYQRDGFFLKLSRSSLGLPNFVADFVRTSAVDLAFRTPLCQTEAVAFEARTNGAAQTYSWDFGDPASGPLNASNEANPSHRFSAPGQYTVSLTIVTAGNTATYRTRKTLTIYPTPVDELGPDLRVCRGETLVLDAGNPGATYYWSTGEATRTLLTNRAGTYDVRVTYGDCSELFSIRVEYLDLPRPDLGPDTDYCGLASVVLNPQLVAESYLWNTGATSPTLTVTRSGTYWVRTVNGTCEATDTVRVRLFKGIEVELGDRREFCLDFGEAVTLDARARFGVRYQWEPTGETTANITVRRPGMYRVRLTDLDGCTAEDSVLVTINCIAVQAPTAFTPNADGLNDRFGFQGLGIETFEFRIFNRGGRELFVGRSLTDTWDGTYLGSLCPEGQYMYTYTVTGEYLGQRVQKTQAGSFTLLH
jgi:gliding motility-associated-like protein